jgi:hypothetical protein
VDHGEHDSDLVRAVRHACVPQAEITNDDGA